MTTKSYDDFRRDCGTRMAEIFRIYGLPEMPGQVLGVLMASAEPVTLGELREVLGTAKSTLSVAARRLEAFGVVHRTRLLGDRQDYYLAQDDMVRLMEHLIQRFFLPEVQGTSAMLRQMQDDLAGGAGPDWPDDRAKARLVHRAAGLQAVTDGTAHFLNALIGPDGRLDQQKIGELIALLTQLQGESQ
ncbi:MAG: MarR family transcriptional regulator [Myxococcota bacterium]|nr:MarR family transcriptional regulator [Myxococcota bacterium]